MRRWIFPGRNGARRTREWPVFSRRIMGRTGDGGLGRTGAGGYTHFLDVADIRSAHIPYFACRCVYGQRAVLTDYTTDSPPHAVDLFDFSLAAVLSAKGILDAPSTAAAKGHPGRLLSSSTIRAEEDVPLFLDDVETHLPCVRSTLDLKEICIAYMLYADGIIGVNVRPPPFFRLGISMRIGFQLRIRYLGVFFGSTSRFLCLHR
jgi:hypothetical protein